MLAKLLSGRWAMAVVLTLTASAIAVLVTISQGTAPEWFIALVSTAIYAYFHKDQSGGRPGAKPVAP